MKRLVLISSPVVHDQSERILTAAAWLGIAATTVTIDDRPLGDRLASEFKGYRCALVLSADVLSLLQRCMPAEGVRRLMEEHCDQVLVYTAGDFRQDGELLRWFTRGAVDGPAPPQTAQQFAFPKSGLRLSGVFAGQAFELARPAVVSTFNVSDPSDGAVEPILLADERAVFLCVRRGACELFLLAADELPDINERLDRRNGVEEHYARLIPLLIFMRRSFGEACWHSVNNTGRLIIDDPLLVQTYGFLSYPHLRKSMREEGYGASIAFIPWNHWRTSKSNTTRTVDQDPNISICVHGCDHTNREFDDLDPASLQWKAETGLSRMRRHKARTGIPFDPVMVFPQGKFTSTAMAALRSSGYLAAVNTTCFPTNAAANPLTIADFLHPAITKFHGFPLFQRRYPRRVMDFAFDMFLGRPALLVQHHDDFRGGYQELEGFVADLNKLQPELTWPPLATQLRQSCVMRSLGGDCREVRFFTNQFRFHYTGLTRTSIMFSKDEPAYENVSGVLVDGVNVPFSNRNGLLVFEHQVKAGQTLDIQVRDRERRSAPATRGFSMTHTTRVCTRRLLSEFRDNTLAKHPRLLAAAKGIAQRLKTTGDSKS